MYILCYYFRIAVQADGFYGSLQMTSLRYKYKKILISCKYILHIKRKIHNFVDRHNLEAENVERAFVS